MKVQREGNRDGNAILASSVGGRMRQTDVFGYGIAEHQRQDEVCVELGCQQRSSTREDTNRPRPAEFGGGFL